MKRILFILSVTHGVVGLAVNSFPNNVWHSDDFFVDEYFNFDTETPQVQEEDRNRTRQKPPSHNESGSVKSYQQQAPVNEASSCYQHEWPPTTYPVADSYQQLSYPGYEHAQTVNGAYASYQPKKQVVPTLDQNVAHQYQQQAFRPNCGQLTVPIWQAGKLGYFCTCGNWYSPFNEPVSHDQPNGILIGPESQHGVLGIRCYRCDRFERAPDNLCPSSFSVKDVQALSHICRQVANSFVSPQPLPSNTAAVAPGTAPKRAKNEHERTTTMSAPSVPRVYPELESLKQLKTSKSPLFEAFIYCAVRKLGANITNLDEGLIAVTDCHLFEKCIEKVCSRQQQAKTEDNRNRALARFINNWPRSKDRKNEFSVSINNESISMFKAAAEKYEEQVSKERREAGTRRVRPSSDNN